ncbi:MAG: M14 family metallopeptidase [Bryobacteraceae bacterium]|nr:M14 family metallopeptidase [Bryobacteraceae bacterium]
MRFLAILAFAAAAAAQSAAPKFEFWPGTTYDPAIPTFKKVLGFDPGERIASPAQTVEYFKALCAAAPSRCKLATYGQSWERRPLIVATISNETNIRRLPEIQTAMKRLADPRTTGEAEAKRLMSNLPALVMLAYSVHGNEISTTDSAMLAAYHLLAARGSKMVDEILANTVVMIDPIQNPDGRQRFVQHYDSVEGLEPDGNPISADHDEPWPGGRSNHYHFDMNRDWFALTQPETRARIKMLLDWYPLVFVDLHEMGGETTYYFAPEAVPYNPHITKSQRESLDWFGKNNAKHFDTFGFSYFTREVFDAFYPGYGASWPIYYGGIAMTYENASLRGLKYQRADGTVVEYPQSVQRHFVASIASCEAAAQNRQRLVENFYNYRKTAVEEGQKEETKAYVLSRKGDVANVDKLASLLADQGIELGQSRTAFSAGGKDFPAGSYVVSLAQPMKRMAVNYLAPKVEMEKDFLAEQERRRKRKLRDEIYDVTAWNLPMQYGVESVGLASIPAAQLDPVAPGRSTPGKITGGKATVAYLVPWGSTASAKLLASLLRADVKVHSTDKTFTQNGRKFPEGTLIVQVKQNDEKTIHDTMAKLVPPSGAEAIATNTGWVEDGANFGSNNVSAMRKINIAMAWDQPVSSLSAGHARFLIERQYGYPVTMIRTSRLGFADLSKFHVLILPEGQYGGALSGASARLKAWVQAGGTIVGLGSALGFLSDSRVGLLGIQQESLARGTDAPKPAPAKPEEGPVAGKLFTKEEDLAKAIQADRESPDDVAGVLVRAKVDPEHWLTAGAPETVHVMISGRTIYSPIKLDRGINAAVYKGPDDLLASGYLWEENRKQLAFKPFLVVERQGRGHVIGFTADPNFRGYMDGLNLLFLNAIFRGPAHASGFGAAAEE